MAPNPDEPIAVLELKTRLLLYLNSPIEPEAARKIYDFYMPRYGKSITQYRSTAYGDLPHDWTPASRVRFEQEQLPQLYERTDWGYWFEGESQTDARVFLFHGSRPTSEPAAASIIRFDFEWNFDPGELNALAVYVLEIVECVCGTAGYVLNPNEGDYASDAYDLMFGWGMRYWGVDAQDVDAGSQMALDGFPCISWSTMLGPTLLSRDPHAVDRARQQAYASTQAGSHVVIQTEDRPRLIDRNRRESLGNYPAVARSLLPLQVEEVVEFGGDAWDEDSTKRYLHRFTSPEDL